MTYSGDSGKTDPAVKRKLQLWLISGVRYVTEIFRLLNGGKEDRLRNRECGKARACGCVDTGGPRDSGLRSSDTKLLNSIFFLKSSEVKVA